MKNISYIKLLTDGKNKKKFLISYHWYKRIRTGSGGPCIIRKHYRNGVYTFGLKMGSGMFLKMIFSTKTFSTVGTREWPQSRMNPFMSC